MKLRHAAALAIAGWYLMCPPPSQDVWYVPNSDAPIKYWSVERSFDTATECEANLETWRADPNLTEKIDAPWNEIISYEALRKSSARCIASDDPRLRAE